MDKRLICTIGALGVTVALSLMLARLGGEAESLPLREPVADVEIAQSEPPEAQAEDLEIPEYAYLLREHEGRIGVFAAGEEEPEMVFDVLVRFLPDYDQVLMQEGIPARDYAHLLSLIEDYIS